MRRTIGRLARSRQPALLALAVVSLSVGCQSTPRTAADPTEAERRDTQFRHELALSAQSINGGDLAQARAHLAEARTAAYRPSQQEKADDLEHLIDGAEALMDGDPASSGAAWARISDPALRREVAGRAESIGVTVGGEEATP